MHDDFLVRMIQFFDCFIFDKTVHELVIDSKNFNWFHYQIQLLNVPFKMVSDNFMFILTDLLTVSETAAEPPQDEGSSLNSPRNLALEATFINHNFSQQVLKRKLKLHKYIQEISLISNE